MCACRGVEREDEGKGESHRLSTLVLNQPAERLSRRNIILGFDPRISWCSQILGVESSNTAARDAQAEPRARRDLTETVCQSTGALIYPTVKTICGVASEGRQLYHRDTKTQR